MTRRRLSEIARHLVQPDGMVRSDFTLIDKAARSAGIRFDPWQQGVLYILFSRRADGKYACGASGLPLSSARQIGKTFMMETAMFIQAILKPGLTVIWTAHHTRTSDETFQDMCALADRDAFHPYVDRIRRANGQQEIRFKNTSRIMFGARERGFGRGLHSIDVEVFDECQILTVAALDNLIPALNTSPDPLAVFMGNPPKPGDPSEVFQEMRDNALAGHATAYIELAADPDAKPDDKAAWEQANPSYPERTSEEAIARMRATLTEESFRREALGIWDEQRTTTVLSQADWDRGVTDEPSAEGKIAFGLDMPPDRSVMSIAVAVKHDDGTVFVNLEECLDMRATSLSTVIDWVADRWPKACAVAIDAQSPAMSIATDLEKRHVRLTVTNARDLAAATGRVLDMTRSGSLTHYGQRDAPQLHAAMMGATLRPIGSNGATAWNKKSSDIDISPLQAATVAVWGAYTAKRDPRRKQRVRRLT